MHNGGRRLSKQIHKVAILGAGTMGARIAAHFANAGVPGTSKGQRNIGCRKCAAAASVARAASRS